MSGNGGGSRDRLACATFAASFSAFFLASSSLGEGKSIFIVSKANSAIKAFSSDSGSMNSGVLKSLFKAPLITSDQSTQEEIRLIILDSISTKSY